METTMEKVQMITSKGQITLPISWRRKSNARQILLKTRGDLIEISFLQLPVLTVEKEYTVFDALRDNKGKGLKAVDLLKLLKKIDA